MALNGINGINGYSAYQYQNTVNLLRLSSMRSASINSVPRVSKINSHSTSTDPYLDVRSFLTKYESSLTDLEESAGKLNAADRNSVFNDLQAGSTDEAVADVKANYQLQAGTDIHLQVDALALAQKNNSDFKVSQETAKAGEDMNFQISTGSGTVSVNVSAVDENGQARTYRQMYEEAAKAINEQSDAGVRAQVVYDGGKASLSVTSKETGESNGFTISGNTGAASGIENAAVDAQDAQYSVTQNGVTQSYRSESNKITLDYGRIDATLKGVGESDIYSGVDVDAIVSAVEDLVKDYNSVTSLLADNADRGAGAAAHYNSFDRGMADDKTLAQLGITHDKEGNLVLDKEKLKSELENNYERTSELIGGQFGLAERAESKAEAALSSSVQRIVSNDLADIMEQTQGYDGYFGGFRYMNNFTRGGAYNLGNYYTVGMMLNTLA